LQTKTAETSQTLQNSFLCLPAGALPDAVDAACKSSGPKTGLLVAILGFGIGVVSAPNGTVLGTVNGQPSIPPGTFSIS